MASVVRSMTEARRSKSQSRRVTQSTSTYPSALPSVAPSPLPPKLTVISNSSVTYPTTLGASPVVRQMPQPDMMPPGIQLLVRTHKASIIFAFVLGLAALIVYGSTVYTQQLWSKEYRKLKTLQRNERELLAAGESLKGQITQQVIRPDVRLVPKTSSSLIYLKPELPRSTPAVPSPLSGALTPALNRLQPSSQKPFGY